MEIMLNEIADLLRARGLTIAIGTNPAEPASQIWDVSDVPEETVIRVMIFPDYNGYPSFWTSAFASYAAAYIIPIVTRIGDARDEVVQRHLDARRSG
jgi:hypothetical protein